MTTPTKDEIRDFAQGLFFVDNPQITTTPEDEELKESGYWETARNDLMRSGHAEHHPEALAFLEQQAAELGRRVVTDEEHARLVDLERKLEQLKTKEKNLGEREKLLSLAEIQNKAHKLEEKIETREKPEKPYKPKVKACYIPRKKCAQTLWLACKKRGIKCRGCQKLIEISCRRKRGGFPKFPKF